MQEHEGYTGSYRDVGLVHFRLWKYQKLASVIGPFQEVRRNIGCFFLAICTVEFRGLRFKASGVLSEL